MPETTFPSPFRASDIQFLRWTDVEETRRKHLISDFIRITEEEFGRKKADISAREASLSFYPDLTLIAFSLPEVAQDQFFLCQGNELRLSQQLTGSNEPIYEANNSFGLVLTPDTVFDYSRFFFYFVRGTMGSFHIVESLNDIPWLPDAEDAVKAEVDSLLLPLTYRGLDPKGFYCTTASVIFRDALFKTDILVASCALEDVTLEAADGPVDFCIGQQVLSNEDLLLEDLPIKNECAEK